MRIRLTIERANHRRMIPMDYQYYISAWIYKVLKQADKEFANFLHDKGYGNSSSKLYKLFCFSRLDFGRAKMWKEKKLFEINQKDIFLHVSFDVNEAATNFIKGLFLTQEFYLGDKFNGIDFKVVNVEVVQEPEFKEIMQYRLQTPWVVSCKTESDKQAKYLMPYENNFYELSLKHIAEKYRNTRSEEAALNLLSFRILYGEDKLGTPLFRKPEPEKWLKDSKCWKKSGFVNKAGSKDETRVLGNLFTFELIAPCEVHRMVWNAGVSEKSSNGFGWLEIENI